MPAKVARRCVVRGRVQGVWFRASARREAERLGVTGQASNLADGTVEVIACGDEAAVAALIEWLGRGPPRAEVTGVEVTDHAGPVPPDFTCR